MYYIVDKRGKVIATASGRPNEVDLRSRGEFSVYSEEEIPLLEAVYVDGKIRRRKKTQQEIEFEMRDRKREERDRKIFERMYRIAEEQLVKEGVIEPDLQGGAGCIVIDRIDQRGLKESDKDGKETKRV